MLISAATGLPCSLMVTGRWLCRVSATSSPRCAWAAVSGSSHGEYGLTARLLPFTVDGLILAASMLILDASRRNQPAPPLARWCLGAGILATASANLAHGLGHGPIGALVSAWPALAHDEPLRRQLPAELVHVDAIHLRGRGELVVIQRLPALPHDSQHLAAPVVTCHDTCREGSSEIPDA